MTAAAAFRLARAEDQEAIAALAEAAEMFPPEALPPMIAPFFGGEEEPLWLVAEDSDGVAGFLYVDAEFLTVGTYNLRAMATRESSRNAGIGTALIDRCSEQLVARQGRVLLVETSSTDAFADTRAFYEKRGFREEARITGFWAPGDDKVIYWKALAADGTINAA